MTESISDFVLFALMTLSFIMGVITALYLYVDDNINEQPKDNKITIIYNDKQITKNIPNDGIIIILKESELKNDVK